MVQPVPLGSRCAICWSMSGWLLLAAADTAGAGIADQFRVVMSLGDDDHRVRWCVTNCVTITAYGGGLPWILRDASAAQYGRSPLVRALLLLLQDEEAVGSNPATPTLK
jgi:hypothetical protein